MWVCGWARRTPSAKALKLARTLSGVAPAARSFSPAYTTTRLGLYERTRRCRCCVQSDICDPPKPRFRTFGNLSNWVSSPSHKRIDELPTNTTPPALGGLARSAAAKASKASCHGEAALAAVEVDNSAALAGEAIPSVLATKTAPRTEPHCRRNCRMSQRSKI